MKVKCHRCHNSKLFQFQFSGVKPMYRPTIYSPVSTSLKNALQYDSRYPSFEDLKTQLSAIALDLRRILKEYRHCLYRFESLSRNLESRSLSEVIQWLKVFQKLLTLTQETRIHFVNYAKLSRSLVSQLNYNYENSPELHRERGYDSADKSIGDLSVQIIDPEHLIFAKKVMLDCKESFQLLENLGSQFETHCYDFRSNGDWKKIKKTAPIGAHEFLSLVYYYYAPKPNGDQPTYNRFLGSVLGFNPFCKKIHFYGSTILKNPTIKEGSNIHSEFTRIDTQVIPDRMSRIHSISSTLIDSVYPNWNQLILCDSEPTSRLSLLRFGKRLNEVDRASTRWLRSKIGARHFDMPHLITGRPTPVASIVETGEQVLEISATWAQRGIHNRPSAFESVTDGSIYLLRLSDGSLSSEIFHSDDRALEEITEALVRRHRNEQERIKRDAQSRAQQRKFKADRLRQIRSLPKIALEHSFAAGNCRPGTYDFCRILGLDPAETKEIEGSTIARLWRSKGFPQESQFLSAVSVALRSHTSNQVSN